MISGHIKMKKRFFCLKSKSRLNSLLDGYRPTAVSFLIMLCFYASLFSSCTKQKAVAVTQTPTPTTIESVQAVVTEERPTPTPNPSTPEPTPAADPFADAAFILPDSTIRPVAVMIDNEGERPLPQAGIRQAQVVYEILTEHKITRYLAFFWGSMPEMIGPVRSSRHYFLDFVMEYDAVYTHYGYSPQAQSDIKKLHIANINGLVNGDAFWDTDKNKGNWQDSFTSKDKVTSQIAKLKYRTEPKALFPFQYTSTFAVPETGEPALKVDLLFGKGFTAGYTYNEISGLYDRSRNGKLQIERNTGLVVSPRNILIEIVPSGAIRGDEAGRINVQTVGSGKGWYITGGKSRAITWEKTSREAQTQIVFEDGSALVLNPGQLWIEIIPTADTVHIE